jgi:hypothetical protein
MLFPVVCSKFSGSIGSVVCVHMCVDKRASAYLLSMVQTQTDTKLHKLILQGVYSHSRTGLVTAASAGMHAADAFLQCANVCIVCCIVSVVTEDLITAIHDDIKHASSRLELPALAAVRASMLAEAQQQQSSNGSSSDTHTTSTAPAAAAGAAANGDSSSSSAAAAAAAPDSAAADPH